MERCLPAWRNRWLIESGTGLPVEKVVDAICKALESEHPKSRYAVPRKKLTGWLIPRWLPDRWLDRLTASRLGLTR